MKIAIASSGLGHLARGVETWAVTLARELAARGTDVTLFTGSELASDRQVSCKTRVLPCWHRGTIRNKFCTAILSGLGGWRYGYGAEYQTEQATMAPHLIRALGEGGFDIVHLQDPWLALLLEKAGKKGKHAAKVILAHGTEESIGFLSQFDCVQHLAPWHLKEGRRMDVVTGRNGEDSRKDKTRRQFCIPNFVDTEVFKPSQVSGFRLQVTVETRKRYGVPEDAFVVGAVAAVEMDHKRIDYLINEFEVYERKLSGTANRPPVFLLIAGAETKESRALMALGDKVEPGRVRILLDLPREQMPDLYRNMDVFVHSALFEMMPIAFLEAMASGLPVICHHHPVMRWIIGEENDEGQLSANSKQLSAEDAPGGMCIDMRKEGGLAKALKGLTREWIRKHGALAHERAKKLFSAEVVISQIVKMYEEVGGKQSAVNSDQRN